MMNRIVFVFGICALMLVVNLGGLIFADNLQHRELNSDRFGVASIKPKDAIRELESMPINKVLENIERVNHIFSESTVPYWPDGTFDSDLRPNPFNNWLLYLTSFLDPALAKTGVKRHTIDQIEILDYKGALRRGVGQCSQYAIMVVDYLRKKGVDASVVGLEGHVVALAKGKGGERSYLIDRGIVLPFGIDVAESAAEMVARKYEEIGTPPDTAAHIAELYGPEGNRVFTGDYRPKLRLIYTVANLAKWVIPLTGIILCVFLGFQNRRGRNWIKKYSPQVNEGR